MPELAQQATDHVYHLRSLPDDEIARAVDREQRLLVLGLQLHEPHNRSPNGLADRLGVGSIRLVASRTA